MTIGKLNEELHKGNANLKPVKTSYSTHRNLYSLNGVG
jgi:hypothetical protein